MIKKYLFLFGLVVLLAGYLSWDIYQEKNKVKDNALKTTLFGYPADQVNEFEIRRGELKIKLSKTIDGWQLVEPLQDKADDGFIEDFIAKAMKDQYLEVAKEGEQIDWKLYGLDKPVGEIEFKTQTGQARTILISAKQNFEMNSMARFANENRVLIVPSSWGTHVTRTVQDFRDKRLFRHRVGAIDRIVIKRGPLSLELARKDGEWSEKSLKDKKIDSMNVREFLTHLSDARLLSFDEPTYQQKLINPDFEIQIGMSEKVWSVVGQFKEGKLRVQIEDKVHLIDPQFSKKLSQFDTDFFRDKKEPFQFASEQVKVLELVTAIKKTRMLKKDQLWLLDPPQEDHSVESEKVESLIKEIKGYKALRYEAPTVTENWVQTLIFQKDNSEELLRLSWSTPRQVKVYGEDKKVRMMKSSLSSEYFLIEDSIIQNLVSGNLFKVKDSKSTQIEQNKEVKNEN